MRRDLIPGGYADFTKYIVRCHSWVSQNRTEAGIPADALAPVTTLLMAYLSADDKASDPKTATQGNRDERRKARKGLVREWRMFVNQWIRFNSRISIPDKEIFRVFPRDDSHTAAKTPKSKGLARVDRVGAYAYVITVVDEVSLKRKLPEDAAGTNLYLAVSEPGVVPERLEEYRKLDFSSNGRHVLDFVSSQLGMQGNVFVRYANRHGKEGPIGGVEGFFIN